MAHRLRLRSCATWAVGHRHTACVGRNKVYAAHRDRVRMAYENHRRGVGRATVRKVCDNRPHLHRAADHKFTKIPPGAGRATVHKVCDNRLPLRRAVGHKVYENRRRGASRVVGHRAFIAAGARRVGFAKTALLALARCGPAIGSAVAAARGGAARSV